MIGVSSMFVKLFGAPQGTGLHFATWNARAFCHYKANVAVRKVEYLKSVLSSGAIVGMQEVHGSAVRKNALI